MTNELPEINYIKSSQNPTIDAETSIFELPYYKDDEFLYNWENFANFIKAVERLVRNNKIYTAYIRYLKETIGLTFCQVLSNIEDEYASIEMHHGPILTLFDYCSIVTEHNLVNNKKINTFLIADTILKEHMNNNIQVVMISKTVHEQVHENNIFLNMKHGFGDINKFIRKYRKGITPKLLEKINRYIDLCDRYNSFDKKVLDLDNTIRKYC